MDNIIFAVGVSVTFMVCGGLFFSGFRKAEEKKPTFINKPARTEA